jgi:uncharacterized protein
MHTRTNPIFVDTSAFYALLDRSDRFHVQASALWPDLLDDRIRLLTSNYVVWETIGLLQKRIGFEAARVWSKDILGVLDVHWVNEATHQRAYDLWLNFERIKLSLVDCVSFVIMHQHGIERAFCFKPHFIDHGFELIVQTESLNPL